MLTMRFDIDDADRRAAVPLLSSALEAAARLPRVSGAHLLGADEGVSGQSTAESKGRSDLLAPALWVVLLEGCDVDALDAARVQSRAFAELRDAAVGRYVLEHTRLKTAWQAG
jgi:hypothetical protein